jgi:D-alanyl-lipoteichoic acid acyltransferase DltB (MBOAT superfamily)
MLFNSIEYACFFVAVLLVYYALPFRAQNVWLLAASYFFYGSWDWRFLSLLWLSTVIDYAAGLAIQAARERDHRRAMRAALTVSVGAQLAILGFFKYFNFFADTAALMLGRMGFHPSLPALTVILPVGISFYTFQTMSYTIDIYRGRFQPTRTFVDFALSVAFFPHLIAGPIQRARSLLVQIERPRVVTQDCWERGLALIAIGLIRKVAIADPAGTLADAYFAHPSEYTSVPLACGLMLYGLQIYNDFAGYSEMARGSANLMGFELMRNFRHPYFARNVSEFWTRWHISLSTWLRDYLYIPLGGSRRGTRRTYLNLMLTMLLGGLWHGASWNFVIWGGLHGTYLTGYHGWKQWRGTRDAADIDLAPRPAWWIDRGRTLASALAVYALVTFTWVFFRSHDIATTGSYLSGLFAFRSGFEGALLPVLALAAFTLAIDVPQALADDECALLQWAPLPRVAFITGGVLLLLFSGNMDHEGFIYFQF